MVPNFGITVDLEHTLARNGYKVVEAIGEEMIRIVPARPIAEWMSPLVISRHIHTPTLTNLLLLSGEMFVAGTRAGVLSVRNKIREALGLTSENV